MNLNTTFTVSAFRQRHELGRRVRHLFDVGFGSLADICGAKGHVRAPIATAKADSHNRSCPLYPDSRHVQRTSRCPLWANSGQNVALLRAATGPTQARRISRTSGARTYRRVALTRNIAHQIRISGIHFIHRPVRRTHDSAHHFVNQRWIYGEQRL